MSKILKKTRSIEPDSGAESIKNFDDYEQSYPRQLALFEYVQPKEKNYSNTVELYDFMPKYHWGKTERINGKFLESLEREFECRGVKYKIELLLTLGTRNRNKKVAICRNVLKKKFFKLNSTD